MKKLTLTMLALLLALPVAAQAKTAEELAKEIVSQNGTREGMEKLQGQIIHMMMEPLKKVSNCLDENAVSQLTDVAKNIVSIDETMGFISDVYSKEFTAEELQQILEFNQSPAGKKLIDKMPVIMEQAMAFSQQKVQGKMPEIQTKTQAILSQYLDNNGECKKKDQDTPKDKVKDKTK